MKKKEKKVIVRRKHIEAAKKEIVKPYRCFYCKTNYFSTEDEMNEHHLKMHGKVSEQKHEDAPDEIDHQIYMKHYGKTKSVDTFNPKVVYKRWQKDIIEIEKWKKEHITEPIVNWDVNDVNIPEKNRIYTKSKKMWCAKTTKSSADLFIYLHERRQEQRKNFKSDVCPPEEKNIVKPSVIFYIDDKKVMGRWIYDGDKGDYGDYRHYDNNFKEIVDTDVLGCHYKDDHFKLMLMHRKDMKEKKEEKSKEDEYVEDVKDREMFEELLEVL